MNIKFMVSCFAGLLFLITTSGCSVVQVVVSHDSNLEKLRDGEHQFTIGNYDLAAQIFIEVSKNTNKPKTRNIALYNLACTRIMLAEEDIDLLEAFETLARWKEAGQRFLYEENPDLSVAALKKQSAYLKKQAEAIKDREANFEEQLKEKDQKSKNRLAAKQKELDELQHKLSELEAIDLELQEKKKPL